MAPRITFSQLPFGPNWMGLFDQAFADNSALSIIPCTCTATNNNLTLTSIAAAFPFNLTSYGSFYGLYTFVASNNSTGNTTANVNGLGILNVYLSDGINQATTGAITAGGFYALSYSAALNNNNGGFYLIQTGSATFNLTLTGDVTASGASPLATTIAPNVVDYTKLQAAVNANVLLGNPTTGGSNYQEITVGPTLVFNNIALETAPFTGDVVTADNSFVTTISNNAITVEKLAAINPQTVLGNPTNAIAPPVAVDKPGLTTLVNTFDATHSGAVPASPGASVANFLRGDGTWAPNPGSLIYISTLDAAGGVASLQEVSRITADFGTYVFYIDNIIATINSSTNFYFQVSTDMGVTWHTTNEYQWTSMASSGAVVASTDNDILPNLIGLPIGQRVDNANPGVSGTGYISNIHSIVELKWSWFSTLTKTGGGSLAMRQTSGFLGPANNGLNPVNGFRWLMSVGNVSGDTIASGKLRIYGLITP